MIKLKYTIKGGSYSGMADSAYLSSRDEDLNEVLIDAVVETLNTSIEVTIGGVTLFLAAWQDPDHWADDIAQELDCDIDEAPDRIAALLREAVVEE